MKKAGKQIAVMVGILAICMGLAGCSVVKDVAELVRELTNTEERNYVRDPS